jgi:tRNA threonylcarbamoyl adenosine modification protein YjeE
MTQYSPALTITATTSEAMGAVGAALGKSLKIGDVVLLFGDLGAGKTTFSRGLIQGIAPDITEIVSPTFTLVQSYELPRTVLYHYDLYRLEKGDESTLTELGWDEARSRGITLVEWSERLTPEYIPSDALQIHITQQPDNSRELKFIGTVKWQEILRGLNG